ncbi:MAG: DUF4861 family protein [Bacteroidota bacterium]
MRNQLSLLLAFLLLGGTCLAQDQEYQYAPSFRYCPDRDFDIAWENDLVAFRVYGKQPNPDAGLSGIDAWHKRVSYPIVDKWYRGNLEGISYHEDHGEGCDQYHVGKSRGVGGIGIWKDEKILRSGLYESWEVISQTQTTISFKLTYSWEIDGERIVETRVISLENGSQLFSAKSHFTKNGIPVKDLEIAVGLSTQNGIAEVSLNKAQGWLSAWHKLGQNQGMIGTGAIVDTKYLVKMLEQKSEKKDESHALAIIKTDTNGSIEWKAGFAWEKAGKIDSKKDWDLYLAEY